MLWTCSWFSRNLVHAEVPAVEANPENFELLKKKIEGINTRLGNIHEFTLNIDNYYFVFQGVCLVVISNTFFFVCNNVWFLTLLSIIFAILSSIALGFLVHKWIDLMEQLDTQLTDLIDIQNVLEGEYARCFALLKKYYLVFTGYTYSVAILPEPLLNILINIHN